MFANALDWGVDDMVKLIPAPDLNGFTPGANDFDALLLFVPTPNVEAKLVLEGCCIILLTLVIGVDFDCMVGLTELTFIDELIPVFVAAIEFMAELFVLAKSTELPDETGIPDEKLD